MSSYCMTFQLNAYIWHHQAALQPGLSHLPLSAVRLCWITPSSPQDSCLEECMGGMVPLQPTMYTYASSKIIFCIHQVLIYIFICTVLNISAFKLAVLKTYVYNWSTKIILTIIVNMARTFRYISIPIMTCSFLGPCFNLILPMCWDLCNQFLSSTHHWVTDMLISHCKFQCCQGFVHPSSMQIYSSIKFDDLTWSSYAAAVNW